MSAPTAPEASALYASVAPLVAEDEQHGWQGSKLITAVAAPLEPIGLIARDISLLTDPVNGPDFTIRFQAMIRGLRGAYGESIARLRDRMVNPPSWEVGSSEAIAESVRGVLTRSDPDVPATVRVLSNRSTDDPGAYVLNHTTVVVRPEEVDVPTAVIQTAAEAGAPDWVVLHIIVGALWADESYIHATWTHAAADHPNWSDMAEGH